MIVVSQFPGGEKCGVSRLAVCFCLFVVRHVAGEITFGGPSC
jgi:hypothetical protein